MRLSLKPIIQLALLLLMSQACNPGPCDATVNPAILAWITDSLTGEPRAQLARGAVQDGAYSDSLQLRSYNDGAWVSRAAAYGRVGIYTVTVVADGYFEWQRTGVRALQSGYCGIETVRVDVRLVPGP